MENKFRNYDYKDDYVYNDHTKEIKEIINGKIYYMAGGTFLHVRVIGKIAYIFNRYFDQKNSDCFADTSDLKVYLDRERSKEYVLPDIVVTCDESKVIEGGYKGDPELIVEVMSDATRRPDRMDKFELYEKSGVKEYWIVEPELKSIEQYVLSEGRYYLREVLKLLKEDEFNNLSEEQKTNYTTIIKPAMFNDLEVDLNEIFPQKKQNN